VQPQGVADSMPIDKVEGITRPLALEDGGQTVRAGTECEAAE
jgi:hypothetical protein